MKPILMDKRTTGDIWRELCQVNDNISKMEEALRLAKERRYRLHKEHMRRMKEHYDD